MDAVEILFLYVCCVHFANLYFSDKFMSEEITEYEIGKRHVANIMGLDPETITQEDIDVSLSNSVSFITLVLTLTEDLNFVFCYEILNLYVSH